MLWRIGEQRPPLCTCLPSGSVCCEICGGRRGRSVLSKAKQPLCSRPRHRPTCFSSFFSAALGRVSSRRRDARTSQRQPSGLQVPSLSLSCMTRRAVLFERLVEIHPGTEELPPCLVFEAGQSTLAAKLAETSLPSAERRDLVHSVGTATDILANALEVAAVA